MRNWQDVVVSANTTILDAMKAINESSTHGVVVAADGKLLGVVTDGDIRRGILKGINLTATVQKVMNSQPKFLNVGADREEILAFMHKQHLTLVPIIDGNRVIQSLECMDSLLHGERLDNSVVIMAGGLGTRLRPLTETCPKPLLKVGDRPLLETILLNFKKYGFSRFYVSVNYKAEMVMDYFGNGERYGVEIAYLQETEPLGTAGGLGRLPKQPDVPFIVMNGDLLTKVDFKRLLDFHVDQRVLATMCVRQYSIEVPYGVVKIENSTIVGHDEKPVNTFFVNAGIYVLDPKVLQYIPGDRQKDMPEVFENLIASGERTAAFPIHEYWLDVGKIEDFRRANVEYLQVFS